MVERSYHAYTKRRRSPWAALLTALVVVAAAWLAGGLAAVIGWPLWARWLAAALVWPLVPFALLILVSPRLGHRRVSLTIAIVGVGVVAALWRPALIDAATRHATWMLGDDDDGDDDGDNDNDNDTSTPPPPTPEPTPPPAPPSATAPQPDDVEP
ncbi:MAG: hypothetical protein KC486_29355, partial [Myxococcales bacterium]|nr:hypothetical protein [Myxococcales bacterium]